MNQNAPGLSASAAPLSFTLRQLECFVAVADTGSVTAAAARLRASDSAVSDALTSMERGLGATLLQRRRARGATLTSDGATVLPMARRVLAEAETLAAAAGRRALSVAGPVRVGAVGTLGPNLLPRVMREIGERYPGIRVEYRTADLPSLLVSLADAEIDIVLTFDIDMPPQFRKRTLYRTEACIVVSADHPLAGQATARLEDVAAEPMVLLDIETSRVHTLELMSSRGISPRVVQRTDNYDLCRSLVGRGFGYTLLMWREGISPAPDGAPLAVIRIEPEPRPVDVVLVSAADHTPPRVAAFVEVAEELFAASTTTPNQD